MADARLRTVLPYGVWVCDDGREVLFNRDYTPIWQRVGDIAWAADPEEWVTWRRQAWFYNDNDIRYAARLCRRLEEILAAFHAGEDVLALAQVVRTRRAA